MELRQGYLRDYDALRALAVRTPEPTAQQLAAMERMAVSLRQRRAELLSLWQ